MKYSKNLCLIVLLAIARLSAQNIELGNVTKEELTQKTSLVEPDADAEILFENGITYMDLNDEGRFTMVTQVDVKIKIYNKDGYQWGNKSIPYYIGTGFQDKVDISKAITYNLVNGKIEETKLKSEGEFDEKVNKLWAIKKIAMPNVREGSIVEFRYVVRSPDIGDIPTWYFQNSIPVRYSKFVTKIPEFYIFKTNFRGIMPKVEETSKNRTHTFVTVVRPNENVVSKSGMMTDKINFIEKISTYTAENVPAIKDEEYVDNSNNYTSSVEYELSMTSLPDRAPKSYSDSWDDVVRTIYKADDFGGELQKAAYFDDDLKQLTANTTNDAEKTIKIFNHVKEHMNWNGLSSYYCKDGVKKAYKDKVGNAAEINLILTAMLKAAGIKAHPVLVSTRANGISFFPTLTAFNYVITAVELENGIVFLDATDKATLPNILPTRDLNWFGRLVREDGTSESVSLNPTALSRFSSTILCEVDAQGKVSGNARNQFNDYFAYDYRTKYRSVSNDNHLEMLEKDYDIAIGKYETTENDLSKPVTESFAFDFANGVEIIGDRLYISPLLFLEKKENPFKQEKREYPVDYVFPRESKFAITIKLPAGYGVETLPPPINLAMGEKAGLYKFNISVTGNQIQVISIFDIYRSTISAEEYGDLKEFYQKMIAKQNEKIILKKI